MPAIIRSGTLDISDYNDRRPERLASIDQRSDSFAVRGDNADLHARCLHCNRDIQFSELPDHFNHEVRIHAPVWARTGGTILEFHGMLVQHNMSYFNDHREQFLEHDLTLHDQRNNYSFTIKTLRVDADRWQVVQWQVTQSIVCEWRVGFAPLAPYLESPTPIPYAMGIDISTFPATDYVTVPYVDDLSGAKAAWELLTEYLDEHQQSIYTASGVIPVIGSAGGMYVVKARHNNNIVHLLRYRKEAIYCASMTEKIPLADLILTLVVMLTTDEKELLKYANFQGHEMGSYNTEQMKQYKKLLRASHGR